MNYENLTKTNQKTLNRFHNVENGINVLRLFFDAGYRTKREVYILLVATDSKYLQDFYKNDFDLLWISRQFKASTIADLYNVINKINALK